MVCLMQNILNESKQDWASRKRKEKLAITTAPPPLTTPTLRSSLGSRLKNIRESKAKEKKKKEELEHQQQQQQQMEQQQGQLQQFEPKQPEMQNTEQPSDEINLAETGEEETMATAKTTHHLNVYKEETAAAGKPDKKRFPPKIPQVLKVKQ